MGDDRQYIECRDCRAFNWSGWDEDWGWCQLLPPQTTGRTSQSPDEGCWSGIPKAVKHE